MRTALEMALGLILIIVSTAWSEEETLVRLFREVSPSVGALYAQSPSGDLSFLCTVTAIGIQEKEAILLTANHCVRKDVAYMVTFDGKVFISARVWKVPPESIDPNKYRRQYGEAEVDAALFLAPVTIKPIALGHTTVIGERVFTIGFPLGIAKIQYEGRVAGVYDRPGSDAHGYLMLQIFGAPGSSGSAVIEKSSQTVVGILVSTRQDRIGLPVIFATPIRYLEKLMEVPR